MKYFHRFNILVLLIVSSVWACFALQTNPFTLIYSFQVVELIKFTYVLGFTVVFWPIFYLEVCDLIYTLLGRNGKNYTKFLSSIKKDLIISFGSAFILMTIYWGDSISYEFSGIDLGFIGAPFILTAIYSIFQMMRTKVAGEPVRKPVLIIMLLLITLFAALAYNYLQKNSSGQFDNYQAIWFQMTILFASFYFYINTSYQLYFLKNSKMELSKFKVYFFKEVFVSKDNLIGELEDTAEKINKQTLISKSKHAASKRKKK